MQRLLALFTLVLMVLGATIIAVPGVRAAEGSVAGTVEVRESGVTSPFEGVTVRLLDGVGAVVAETLSGADGTYTLTAEEGSYTLEAEPPDASGLTPTTQSVTIAGGTETPADILFVIDETRVPVTGTITGLDGMPVAGARVVVNIPGDPDPGDVGDTDAAGAFSLEVLPGREYAVTVVANDVDERFPGNYRLTRRELLQIDAATSFDLVLPTYDVTFSIEELGTGAPIPVASFYASSSTFTGPAILGVPSRIEAQQGASVVPVTVTGGTITVPLGPGSGSATASADGYLPATEVFTPESTPAVTLALEAEPEPGTTIFTGRVLDRDGSPIGGAEILGIRPGGLGTTLGDGTFEVEDDSAPNDGTGRLIVRSFGGTGLPDFWEIGSTQVPHPDGQVIDLGDIDVPTNPVTFTVVDPDGIPVPGAFWDARGFNQFPRTNAVDFAGYPGFGATQYRSSIQVDADGQLEMELFATDGSGPFDLYQLEFSPPPEDTCEFSRYRLRSTTVSVAVSGPTDVTVELEANLDDPCPGGPTVPTTPISGRLLLGGESIERVFLGFITEGDRTGFATGADGGFAGDIPEGNHDMDVIWLGDSITWPELRLASTETVVSASGREPIDLGTFDVPLADLTVTVRTVDGRPIEGVSVSTMDGLKNSGGILVPRLPTVGFEMNGFQFEGTSEFSGSPSTGPDGVATLPLLPGDYDLRFEPPSGFEPLEREDVTVSEVGGSLLVQLAYPHDPPTAAIGVTGDEVSSGVFRTSALVTITASAADGFSPDVVEVSVDGGAPFTYSGPFEVTGVGTRTITAQVTDDGSVTGPPTTADFEIVAAPGTPTTTTTTTPPADDPPVDDPGADPTTTTTAPVQSIAQTTTTTTVAAQTGEDTTTTTVDDGAALPETGRDLSVLPAVLLLAGGFALVLGTGRRRREG